MTEGIYHYTPTIEMKDEQCTSETLTWIAPDNEPTRFFAIRANNSDTIASYELPVSLADIGTQLMDGFVVDGEHLECNEVEVSLLFMRYLVGGNKSEARLAFLAALFKKFAEVHLMNDPHVSLPSKLNTLSLSLALRIYYDVTTSLGIPLSPCGAKFIDKKLKKMAIFGGQACSDDLLSELKLLLDTYHPLIYTEFKSMAAILKTSAEDKIAQPSFMSGFDIVKWVEGPQEKWPSKEYVLAAPMSLPLIGLIQLLNYRILMKTLGVTPEVLAQSFACATGHSQGIIPAALIALVRSEEDFSKGCGDALRALFWIGLRAQLAFPLEKLSPTMVNDLEAHNEGLPSPMLSVRGMSRQSLEKVLSKINSKLNREKQLEIGLKNGPSTFIVCGSPSNLYNLVLALRPLQAGPEDQSRVPYSERKLKFAIRFLPISAPFHSSHLKSAVPKVLADLARVDCNFFSTNSAPLFPVFHTQSGEDFTSLGSQGKLLESLVEQICTLPVDWPKVSSQEGVTHLLDFGPGHASGIGSLTERNIEGSGAQVVLAGTFEPVKGMLTKADLYKGMTKTSSWKEQFSPKVITADKKRWVDTRFSRLLGKPPIMVAGMTPCTVPEPFVSACIQAGYHVELSGGGHFNEEVLRAKIDAIIEKVGIGCTITLNSLFLNPRLWAIQYPVMKQMRQEGYPIEGFCVAAGVPSFDSAVEIVESMREVGIRHVAFKPGSKATILEVVRIAQACPKMPVILQWTGGRGGGHHSFEDFHEPILETYAAIRAVPNLILVGGSGFGDGEGSLPYMTGDWSLPFERPPMPFDGILLGSRMMVAAENQASRSVKELIVAASGIPDERDWVTSYKKPVGGVVTVRSELGEPIHKIATRGVMFWKELDDTIFSMPAGEKRLAAVKAKRDHIIKKLNDDHQKVWFGKRLDGAVCDLTQMTYYEVARRLGELVYVWHQNRWIDVTYKKLLELFLRRVEERLLPVDSCPSKVEDHSEWFLTQPGSIKELNPTEVIEPFFASFPQAKDHVISTEDVQGFLAMCMIPWHKPVPFIPTLDDDRLEYWFKKDSLWQSEDVEAVIGQDAQRVAILHGPVAAKYSKRVDEPVKEILDDINQYYLDHLTTGGQEEEEWFGGEALKYPIKLAKACTTECINHDKTTLLITQPPSVTTCDWLDMLSGPSKNWLRALLRSSWIIQGPKALVPNKVRALFRPRPGFSAKLIYNIGDLSKPEKLVLLDKDGDIQVEASITGETIAVQVHYNVKSDTATRIVPLTLLFEYRPHDPYGLIKEITDSRISRVKEFYWNLWFTSSDYSNFKTFDPVNGVIEESGAVDQERCERFCKIVGNSSELYRADASPMDYCMVAAWEPVMKVLFCDAIQGDILQLVHLSNKIENLSSGATGLKTGQNIKTKARVNSIVQGPSGKTVSVQATISDQSGTPIIRVTSAFFFREGTEKTKSPILFERHQHEETTLQLKHEAELEIFLTKDWAKLQRLPSFLEVNNHPIVLKDVETLHCGPSYKTTGLIGLYNSRSEWVELGKISHDSTTNAVDEYMKRVGNPRVTPTMLESDGYLIVKETITSPADNQIYSTCSGDHNPIHTSPLIAAYAGLPGTITHGLWTSAAARSVLERAVEADAPTAVVSYKVEFTEPVLPNQELEVSIRHIGMRDGHRIIKIEAHVAGTKVLQGEALVRQLATAYVFTGQGSQEVGMGMDLYASSPIAKHIWDRADAHFLSVYGFSILEIVRKNPKTLTVHFGGPLGAKIRELYLSLTYVTEQESIRLFPEVTPTSASFTFTSPAGLLSMTQFTQPALTLMEMAAFQTMRSKGLISPSAPFAGHSLGEYAALASVAQILDIEALSDVVFYRGMCMQVAVKRDADGRSPFGMAAVNPSRVSRDFTQEKLQALVKSIAKETGLLLEIVNYNVKNWQYVVAGDLHAIETLTIVINSLAKQKGEGDLVKLIADSFKKVPSDLITTTRGIATIPLTGIDVPFHSSFLLNGVIPFRQFLKKRFEAAHLSTAKLVNKYVPNLVAVPFRLDKAYFELVFKQCQSPVLGDVLANWNDSDITTKEGSLRLTTTLLTELLSYQFASPVRWIETQEVFFRQLGVQRFIEIGPSPTLCGMADRTLKADEELVSLGRKSQIRLLAHSRDHDDIYYIHHNAPEPEEVKPVASTYVEQPKAMPTVTSAPQSMGPVKAIDEIPLRAAEIVQVIVAQKTRRSLTEIPTTKTIKEISGGKSTLQNELVGELGKEFGAGLQVDKPEEVPMQELGAQIERNSWNGVPGKLVSGLIAKLFSGKMPSGFSASSAKQLLQSEFGISPKASDTIFTIALLSEPASRFASEDAAKTWLRDLTKTHLASKGISVASAATQSTGSASVISAAELEKINAKQNGLIRKQIELFAAYLGDRALWDAETKAKADANLELKRLQSELDLWLAEHGGSTYADGIKPIFSPLKARRYDSWWNWVRQEAALVAYHGTEPNEAMLKNRADPELVQFLQFLAASNGKICGAAEIVRANLNTEPLFKPTGKLYAPKTTISEAGQITYKEVPRNGTLADYVPEAIASTWIHLRSRSNDNEPSQWYFDQSLTSLYKSALSAMTADGQSFAGKNVLMTGCGRGSIGAEMLKGLLEGGAQVVITTSSYSRANLDHFRSLYEQHGAKGSCLIVVPFNQGSLQDVNSLVNYIYEELGWELDAIVPFGAIPENGRSLMDLEDGKSELAHRLMLTNVLRLIGSVAKAKEARGVRTRPAQVILPLSPNHGVFGFDGLYGESKVALETLFNRWHSETWSDYLGIVGAVIGWTRGTGLMNDNNLVAEQIEALGVRTFSSTEMALNLLGLMTPSIVQLSETGPVYADLAGGMGKLRDLHLVTKRIRDEIAGKAIRLQLIHQDKLASQPRFKKGTSTIAKKKANFNFGFGLPTKPQSAIIEGVNAKALRELLDLAKTVVVTGYGEVGPFGGSRTRWEIESTGKLSLEGCIELAWIMGLVRWDATKSNPNGPFGGAWIDVASGALIADTDIKAKYEEHILKHTGIRLIEPGSFGYDPAAKGLLQEIVLQEDLGPIEMSQAEAQSFQLRHKPEELVVEQKGDQCLVRFKAGCTMFVPKALQMDRFVSGQLPTGWDAARYGVPKDIIDQVDSITLYVLVSTVEALVSAGITDPYEFYQYVHLAEVGNTMGGGMGGMVAQRNIYRERFLDGPTVKSDVLQESFINTMPAWINLLLLSSAGPIKTPVGACATAVESVEIGVDTILSGKAKIVLVGGYDNFTEESSTEFAKMGATSNSAIEQSKGREPAEMSRPMAASRGGFMESLGAGTHVLMTAELAIRMGCPIYGIVACTHMAMDKEGRSIPAPGQGVLTTARRSATGDKPRILDIEYRLRQFERAKDSIQQTYQEELELDPTSAADLTLEMERRMASERRLWGSDFASGDTRIAPLESALSKYGLTIDDIALASFHGTGTAANDTNETQVLHKQLTHLGRTPGNMLPAVCQKYLTGHPKGAAAAWMLNGALQAMNSGVVPPNRNADSIEPKLRQYSTVFQPTKALHMPHRINAALLKSFGFGQVGGEVLLVHPDFVLATLPENQYSAYMKRRAEREQKAALYTTNSILQVSPLIKVKTEPPFKAEDESRVYLDPTARATFNPAKGTWSFPSVQASQLPVQLPKDLTGKGVGVDVQLITDLPIDNADFVTRNFTAEEIKYCTAQPDSVASFAGKWAAKEAIVKALCSQAAGKPEWLKGAGAPLKEIQVMAGPSGAPQVIVNGVMQPVKISISHSGSYAVAVAVLE